jgi:lysophospholipase L1-like esterase
MPYRRVFQALLCSVALFLLVEVMLQIRSQLRHGQSVFSAVAAQKMYQADLDTGLVLLRPNSTFSGSEIVIRSNSLGLRSPEIDVARTPGSLRIAVIGASTVMGAYAASNEESFPALMEARLRVLYPNRLVEVVNAGMVGYSLADQRRMLTHRVTVLHPDLVIVYPGSNDFAGYCREKEVRTEPPRQGLPTLSLPNWLLSTEILLKNTSGLREVPVPSGDVVDAAKLDISTYVAELEQLIESSHKRGMKIVLATNARAYRRDQEPKLQQQLSRTARFYNHCFSLEGLHVLYERHNLAIRETGALLGVPVVDLHNQIPGGTRFFVDSHHFTKQGESVAADALVTFLTQHDLLGTFLAKTAP